MMNFDTMSLEELTTPAGYDGCACGRKHECPMEFVAVERNALSRTAEMVRKLGGTYPYIICDKNTYEAAGKRVISELEKAGIPYKLCMLRGERPAPDELSVGSAIMHLDLKCDLILSVGSGVVNDTGKVVGNMTGKKQAVIGTAPSMDGYASDSAAMEIDDVKVSLYGKAPCGILLDVDVLKEAPMRMLWAGYGDIIAKYTGILEWRIANLIHGDYYCEEVAALMRAAVQKVEKYAEGIPSRDPEAVKAIAEGLVLAGIAMSYAKISRPASGLEHSISHLWEMMALEQKRPYDLHGIQVGVGTVMDLKIYEKLRKITPDRARAEAFMTNFTEEGWKADVERIFGKTAPEIFAVEEKTKKNDPARHAAQLKATLENWDTILKMMDEELPDYETEIRKMRKIGMPVTPSDIGYTVQSAMNAFTGAREIKDKYMINNTIWDLGLAKEFEAYLGRVVNSDSPEDKPTVKAVALDLDGTLTQHKSQLSEAHWKLLDRLGEKYHILMVGAGTCIRIYKQMREYPIEIIGNYGMMHSVVENGEFRMIRDLSVPCDRESVEKRVTELREKYGFTSFAGRNVEFHPSGCVTIPLLGTEAKIEDKIAFDPDRSKRRAIYEEVKALFPEYTVFVGGSSSYDMTPAPYQKAYALEEFAKEHGFTKDEVVYVGDDYGPGGGDETVLKAGFPFIKVDDYRDFEKAIAHLL